MRRMFCTKNFLLFVVRSKRQNGTQNRKSLHHFFPFFLAFGRLSLFGKSIDDWDSVARM